MTASSPALRGDGDRGSGKEISTSMSGAPGLALAPTSAAASTSATESAAVSLSTAASTAGTSVSQTKASPVISASAAGFSAATSPSVLVSPPMAGASASSSISDVPSGVTRGEKSLGEGSLHGETAVEKAAMMGDSWRPLACSVAAAAAALAGVVFTGVAFAGDVLAGDTLPGEAFTEEARAGCLDPWLALGEAGESLAGDVTPCLGEEAVEKSFAGVAGVAGGACA
mmetsp:Transcript_46883/g.101834  ORF Transcript_46883/g.101834 Transcript_46883/m.101834 type:complete len:227 (-) Transcript_46883:1292-1972(-)